RHSRMGQFQMKHINSGLIRQTIKASAIVAALVLSTSSGHAQTRPFAGFDGAWSGNGTVSLSDGSTERLRCRAVYPVDDTGLVLKQTLRCASDSYKFDLASDVTSHGDHITGNWSETNRQYFRQPAGNGRQRQDRRHGRIPGFYRKPDLAHERQQADGSNHFQGRHQGRVDHDG